MMASRTRGRKRPDRPKRPYLSEWILTQPSPQKEVLLQVFSGTSEAECSRRLHMPVDQVEQIARTAAKEAPLFREDEYEMAYYSAHDAEEFYRITGEGEGTYKFLSLRYPKAERKASAPAAAPAGATPTGRGGQPPRQDGATPRKRKAQTRSATTTRARKAASTARDESGQGATPQESLPQRPAADDPEAQARREARRTARELAAREREWERQRDW